jgi:hypothetical protein
MQEIGIKSSEILGNKELVLQEAENVEAILRQNGRMARLAILKATGNITPFTGGNRRKAA